MQLRRDGVERPHLVGLSLGGWVVLEMAALGFGASVVALAPAGLWMEGERVRSERAQAVLRRVLPLVNPLLAPLTASDTVKRVGLCSLVVDPGRVSHEQFLAAAIAFGQAKGYGICDWVAVRNRFEGAHKVRVPATVAFGDSDRVLPPRTSQNRALIPEGATFSVVDDCGHAMSWDQPGACLELIAETASRGSPA
jgi:pimeloyl-ACP methyl ester carboxylesterase